MQTKGLDQRNWSVGVDFVRKRGGMGNYGVEH
jgi:hypothetical protein